MEKIRIEINNIENEVIIKLLELIDTKINVTYVYREEKLCILYSENYYFRINSNQLTTIIVSWVTNNTKIEIITGGGGEGILGMSWGAENSINKKIQNTITEYCTKNSISYVVQ